MFTAKGGEEVAQWWDPVARLTQLVDEACVADIDRAVVASSVPGSAWGEQSLCFPVPHCGGAYTEGEGKFSYRHRVRWFDVGHRLGADGPQSLPGELELMAFLVQPCVGSVESGQHRVLVAAVAVAEEETCLDRAMAAASSW